MEDPKKRLKMIKRIEPPNPYSTAIQYINRSDEPFAAYLRAYAKKYGKIPIEVWDAIEKGNTDRIVIRLDYIEILEKDTEDPFDKYFPNN